MTEKDLLRRVRVSTSSSNSKEEREKRSVETEAERERETVVYVVTRKERGFMLDKERSHRATRREKEKAALWG